MRNSTYNQINYWRNISW